jgi:hypothetical protein
MTYTLTITQNELNTDTVRKTENGQGGMKWNYLSDPKRQELTQTDGRISRQLPKLKQGASRPNVYGISNVQYIPKN